MHSDLYQCNYPCIWRHWESLTWLEACRRRPYLGHNAFSRTCSAFSHLVGTGWIKHSRYWAVDLRWIREKIDTIYKKIGYFWPFLSLNFHASSHDTSHDTSHDWPHGDMSSCRLSTFIISFQMRHLCESFITLHYHTFTHEGVILYGQCEHACFFILIIRVRCWASVAPNYKKTLSWYNPLSSTTNIKILPLFSEKWLHGGSRLESRLEYMKVNFDWSAESSLTGLTEPFLMSEDCFRRVSPIVGMWCMWCMCCMWCMWCMLLVQQQH